MCCKNLRKTYIPFVLAFMFGSLMANLLSVGEIPLNSIEKKVAPPDVIKEESISYKRKDTGSGCGECPGFHFPIKSKIYPSITRSVKLLSKPQPTYTKEARTKYVEGKTILRITFLANGQIGSISPVSQLPYGLTEQAIEAARKIKFEPAMRNGQPISVTKSIQYTFTIY